MSLKDWIKNNFGPEANLRRLQKEVERKERQAEFAAAEIPLLQKKDQALDILNKKKKIKQEIRKKQLERMNNGLNKPKSESFIKFNPPKSEFKVKSPTDRVYKT